MGAKDSLRLTTPACDGARSDERFRPRLDKEDTRTRVLTVWPMVTKPAEQNGPTEEHAVHVVACVPRHSGEPPRPTEAIAPHRASSRTLTGPA